MQETGPTGTTAEVGAMLTELICGCAGISGLMEIQTQASAKTPTCPEQNSEEDIPRETHGNSHVLEIKIGNYLLVEDGIPMGGKCVP